MTNKGNKLYRNQKVCHISKKEFSTDDKKVRDHCNFTCKYRGAAHDVCNLNYKAPKEIPVTFLHMTIILYSKYLQKIWTTIYMFRRKYRKNI